MNRIIYSFGYWGKVNFGFSVQKLILQIIIFSFHALYFSNVLAQTATENIKLNQLGYYPNAPKLAILTGNSEPAAFYIVSLNDNHTMYQGNLGKLRQSSNSSTKTRLIDFTALQNPGLYKIVIPGVDSSYSFAIKNDAAHEVATASLKGFYFIRSAMPLEKKFAGKWARPAGHPDTAVIVHPSAASRERPAGTIISTPGGWYDAGDYNKYIVNSGISMGTLLSAYEDFSSYFDTLKTNIPETGNGLPDILNEVLYNLRWMITMQDPNDGGVYNKCTNAAFDGMVMPGITKLPRYVVQKGTAASLDFAAVMAQSSRIFKSFEKQLPGLSDSCLSAAIKAWAWAKKNPALEYNQDEINRINEPKITTGGYGDNRFGDEWFWAASELLSTTHKKVFLDSVKYGLNQPFSLPSWSNVWSLGLYSLIRNEKNLSVFLNGDIKPAKLKMTQFADEYLKHINTNAFQTVMGGKTSDFIWGSNSVAANQGIVLINAYLVTGNKNYIDAALSNLDYLLGRNATGYCFVTGLGTKSTKHPHHRPSVADGIDDPVPGLMAGGPNPGRQDHCHYDFLEPETAYADIDCAYASNEIAINWNAPLVYLSNAIEALKFRAGYSK